MTFSLNQVEAVKRRLRTGKATQGRYKVISGVDVSSSYQVAYYRQLLKPINLISDFVEDALLPWLRDTEEFYVRNAPGDIENVIKGQLKTLDDLAESFDAYAAKTASDFVDSNNRFHRRKFVKEIKQQFGVNITGILSEKNVSGILQDTARDNVKLIVDISDNYRDRIRKAILTGFTSGDDFYSIRDEIEKVKGITKRRAKLIAIDQTGSLIGKLNQVRQENEGITKYMWDANLGPRTRPTHRANDGNVYNWNDSSPGQAKGKPGEEIRCRCVADPVIDAGFFAGREIAAPTKKIGLRSVPGIIEKTSRKLNRVVDVDPILVQPVDKGGQFLLPPQPTEDSKTERLRKELAGIQDRNRVLKEQVDAKQKSNTTLRAKLIRLQAQLKKVKAENGALSKRANQLREQIKKVNQEIKRLQKGLR